MKDLNKKVVILFGPPGSGKGTQARLVSEKYNLFHLDTGKFLESLFYFNGEIDGDEELKNEKTLFDSGKLVSPAFVLKRLINKVFQLASNETGVVFSGSPRTLYEAFGDENQKGLAATLEELYKKNNIIMMLFNVPGEVSISRNSSRVLCSVCGTQLLGILNMKFERCPFCGGELRVRSLDKPEIIKTRLEEYKNRTYPVVEELRKLNYEIHNVDANDLPYKIFSVISSIIDDSTKDR